jgi:predicted nuclease with TOPRIM domain
LCLSNFEAITAKQIKREMNENNKDAPIESLKRKIKKLKDENKQLRKQLKVAYTEVYKLLDGGTMSPPCLTKASKSRIRF